MGPGLPDRLAGLLAGAPRAQGQDGQAGEGMVRGGLSLWLMLPFYPRRSLVWTTQERPPWCRCWLLGPSPRWVGPPGVTLPPPAPAHPAPHQGGGGGRGGHLPHHGPRRPHAGAQGLEGILPGCRRSVHSMVKGTLWSPGVVFLVDSSDRGRLGEAARELQGVRDGHHTIHQSSISEAGSGD